MPIGPARKANRRFLQEGWARASSTLLRGRGPTLLGERAVPRTDPGESGGETRGDGERPQNPF